MSTPSGARGRSCAAGVCRLSLAASVSAGAKARSAASASRRRTIRRNLLLRQVNALEDADDEVPADLRGSERRRLARGHEWCALAGDREDRHPAFGFDAVSVGRRARSTAIAPPLSWICSDAPVAVVFHGVVPFAERGEVRRARWSPPCSQATVWSISHRGGGDVASGAHAGLGPPLHEPAERRRVVGIWCGPTESTIPVSGWVSTRIHAASPRRTAPVPVSIGIGPTPSTVAESHPMPAVARRRRREGRGPARSRRRSARMPRASRRMQLSW